MTEQEAIDYFKNATVDTRIGIDNIIKTSSIINISIEALEKQVPKKPLNKTSEFSGDYGYCPCCNKILCDFDNYNYCDKCGQKLDWSE